MKSIHHINWEEICKLLKDKFYEDVHKFYSESGGWCFLTDKFGERHELRLGATINDFKSAVRLIRSANNYVPQGRRAYRYRTAPPQY